MTRLPPRICVVFPGLDGRFAGHAIQTKVLLPLLKRKGISTHIVTTATAGKPSREIVDGIEVRRLPTFGLSPAAERFAFGLGLFFYLIAQRRHYDIVQVADSAWHWPFSLLASKLLGKKAVIEVVLLGGDDPEAMSKKRLGRLRRLVYRKADCVVSLSTALTEACLRAGVERERIAVIPVGVNPERFRSVGASERARLREELGIPAEQKLIVSVGIVTARKGIDLVIDALPHVVKGEPDAHLIVIGTLNSSEEDRSFLAEQRRKLEDAGLESHVTFTGQLEFESVPKYLLASDVFVFPSLREGLPNSVLEAMACGIPTVMSDMPGISRDIIRNDEEGLVVSERTPDAFARAVSHMLESEALRRRMGEGGRRRILDHFTIEKRAERYEHLYSDLLGEVV